jgi:glyoxylase-like metal-dependent hydrolase (beta-lactamase superfamily II)
VLACCGAVAAMAQSLPAIELAAGVHVVVGDSGEASADNGGAIGNIGIIVGGDAIVVINTGSSHRHGVRILETAEALGGKSVVLAIITQPLQEFVMGAAAFAERGIPIVAHEAAARLIVERCERCLANLTALLGEEAMRGTRVVAPDRTVSGSQPIVAGGRPLRLLHYGWAHTPGDLAVLDPASGVLFSGALVSVGRVPAVRDAQPAGWLEALAELERLPVQTLVPGYGPPGSLADIGPVRDYLTLLDERVGALVDDGAGLQETLRAAELPQFAHWALYPVMHPRNVQHRYLRLETEIFDREAR